MNRKESELAGKQALLSEATTKQDQKTIQKQISDRQKTIDRYKQEILDKSNEFRPLNTSFNPNTEKFVDDLSNDLYDNFTAKPVVDDIVTNGNEPVRFKNKFQEVMFNLGTIGRIKKRALKPEEQNYLDTAKSYFKNNYGMDDEAFAKLADEGGYVRGNILKGIDQGWAKEAYNGLGPEGYTADKLRGLKKIPSSQDIPEVGNQQLQDISNQIERDFGLKQGAPKVAGEKGLVRAGNDRNFKISYRNSTSTKPLESNLNEVGKGTKFQPESNEVDFKGFHKAKGGSVEEPIDSPLWFSGQGKATSLKDVADYKDSVYLTKKSDFARGYGNVLNFQKPDNFKVLDLGEQEQNAEFFKNLYDDFLQAETSPHDDLNEYLEDLYQDNLKKYKDLPEEEFDQQMILDIRESLNPLDIEDSTDWDMKGMHDYARNKGFDLVQFKGGDTAIALKIPDEKELAGAGQTRGEPVIRSKSSGDPIAEDKVIETPEFRNWFGDSKVVDESGKPLVVYHGTGFEGELNVFKQGVENTKTENTGTFFTTSKDIAESYKELPFVTGGTSKGQVKETYLSLKKPLIIDAQGKAWDDLDPTELEVIYPDGSRDYLKPHLNLKAEGYKSGALITTDEIVRSAKNTKYEPDSYLNPYAGDYDGVIFKNIVDTGKNIEKDKAGDIYVAFEPTQIKSATRNSGKFDPNNPDIRERTTSIGNDEYIQGLAAAPEKSFNLDNLNKTMGVLAKNNPETERILANNTNLKIPTSVYEDGMQSAGKTFSPSAASSMVSLPNADAAVAGHEGLHAMFANLDLDSARSITNRVDDLNTYKKPYEEFSNLLSSRNYKDPNSYADEILAHSSEVLYGDKKGLNLTRSKEFDEVKQILDNNPEFRDEIDDIIKDIYKKSEIQDASLYKVGNRPQQDKEIEKELSYIFRNYNASAANSKVVEKNLLEIENTIKSLFPETRQTKISNRTTGVNQINPDTRGIRPGQTSDFWMRTPDELALEKQYPPMSISDFNKDVEEAVKKSKNNKK